MIFDDTKYTKFKIESFHQSVPSRQWDLSFARENVSSHSGNKEASNHIYCSSPFSPEPPRRFWTDPRLSSTRATLERGDDYSVPASSLFREHSQLWSRMLVTMSSLYTPQDRIGSQNKSRSETDLVNRVLAQTFDSRDLGTGIRNLHEWLNKQESGFRPISGTEDPQRGDVLMAYSDDGKPLQAAICFDSSKVVVERDGRPQRMDIRQFALNPYFDNIETFRFTNSEKCAV